MLSPNPDRQYSRLGFQGFEYSRGSARRDDLQHYHLGCHARFPRVFHW